MGAFTTKETQDSFFLSVNDQYYIGKWSSSVDAARYGVRVLVGVRWVIVKEPNVKKRPLKPVVLVNGREQQQPEFLNDIPTRERVKQIIGSNDDIYAAYLNWYVYITKFRNSRHAFDNYPHQKQVAKLWNRLVNAIQENNLPLLDSIQQLVSMYSESTKKTKPTLPGGLVCQYRCTRNSKAGNNFWDRQGYYVMARSEAEAVAKMLVLFPGINDAIAGFTVSKWVYVEVEDTNTYEKTSDHQTNWFTARTIP